MKGLITAGGRGTRMQPLTFSTNKHFIPIANKPLLFYAIEAMVEAGIKRIGINYNPSQKEEIENRLGRGEKWGVKFTYILQEKPLGLANIVEVSRQFLGKSRFVMHLGDNIFYGGIADLVNKFRKSRASALLVTIHHPENSRMGVPYLTKEGKLSRVVEKPELPPNDLAVPGLYFFDYHALKCFRGKGAIKPSARGELEIGSIYNWLLKNKFQVEVGEFDGIWRDPGKFDDWLSTNQFLLDKVLEAEPRARQRKGAKIEGRVKIGQGCQIKNSLLRGPIIIGDKVVIENSFIGPYSSIADDCQLTGTRLENTILMRGVKINSPGRPLDTCLIGEETVIKNSLRHPGAMELFLGNRCIVKL